jgi:alpha-tubulin suppressor-like RCC1 family protein
VTALFAGSYHTCARMAGGAIACWGDNAYGQFCNGTMTNASTPVTVSALSGAVTMGAGSNDTCALRSDDSIACCGWNSRGQLGDGTMMNSSTPVPISH